MKTNRLKIIDGHPKLRLLETLIKVSDFLGPQTIDINKKTGDVIHQVTIRRLISPESRVQKTKKKNI